MGAKRAALAAIAWLGCGGLADAAPPPPTLESALVAARQPIFVGTDGISGEGAELLRRAVAEARYVGIGEDHFTNEIPLFAAAMCRLMAPQGLAAYVVEAGPIATERMAAMLGAPDREAQVRAFSRAYPNAVAFLDSRPENAAAASCRAAARRPFRLIGIDQEFLGSGGFLLDRAAKGRLSPPARKAVDGLREKERRAAQAAAASGDPSGLFVLSEDPAGLARAGATVAAGGDAGARRAFDELLATRRIYALNAAGSPEANGTRARLMKRHLARELPATGKVLLKFGDWHLYKGVNPLGELDIGNFIHERAEGAGETSLHILVLAARGRHGGFGGYARPLKPNAFVMSVDKDYRWFALAAANQVKAGWTLYDLRRLRHRRIADVDADWRRVIDGYDLMIVIPEASAAELIGFPG